MEYVELEFEAELTGQRRCLPPFLGATLRGALGYALKETVCQIGHGNCAQCVLQSACPYSTVFEGLAPPGREIMRKYTTIPQPFVLRVPSLREDDPASRMLVWGVRLFGKACHYWPYLIHVYRLVGERGLGKGRLQYDLRRVVDRVGGVPLWSPGQTEGARPATGQLVCDQATVPDRCALRWRLHTPVRLPRPSGRLTGLDLVLAGRRRLQIMDYFYGGGTGSGARQTEEHLRAEEFVTREARLRPWRLERYSGRQQRRMSLDGLVGEIVIEGPWGRSGRWLKAAPLLHLGKATSFGFGRVTWEVL